MWLDSWGERFFSFLSRVDGMRGDEGRGWAGLRAYVEYVCVMTLFYLSSQVTWAFFTAFWSHSTLTALTHTTKDSEEMTRLSLSLDGRSRVGHVTMTATTLLDIPAYASITFFFFFFFTWLVLCTLYYLSLSRWNNTRYLSSSSNSSCCCCCRAKHPSNTWLTDGWTSRLFYSSSHFLLLLPNSLDESFECECIMCLCWYRDTLSVVSVFEWSHDDDDQ